MSSKTKKPYLEGSIIGFGKTWEEAEKSAREQLSKITNDEDLTFLDIRREYPKSTEGEKNVSITYSTNPEHKTSEPQKSIRMQYSAIKPERRGLVQASSSGCIAPSILEGGNYTSKELSELLKKNRN